MKTLLIIGIIAMLMISAQAAETRHVVSDKQQGQGLDGPVFTNLKSALRGSSSSWSAGNAIEPGGTIIIHAGIYQADRYSYRDPHGLMYFGTHFPAAVSEALAWMGGNKPAPLIIKAAGDGAVILDGADCNILMDLAGTVPLIIDGITFQNADVGIVAGERGGVPCAGLIVRNCTFRNVQVGIWADNLSAENYLIENCTFEGMPGRESIGIKLAGRQHALSGNRFTGMSADVVMIESYQDLPPVVGKRAMLDEMPAKSGNSGGDAVIPGDFQEDPATLHCLAFTWWIEGDANRNATVAVAYRKHGSDTWREALPLFRPDMDAIKWGRQDKKMQAWHQQRQDLFAGSIPNLDPGTTYECRLTLHDPDGGGAEQLLTTATASEPAPPTAGRRIYVYPSDFTGTRKTPHVATLDAAFAGPDRARAGDMVVMHAGVYQPSRGRYSDAAGNLTLGGYQIRAEGTPEQYVAITAAGDGPVIIDGDGGECVLDVRFSQYLRVDGITLRNAEIGIKAGHTSTRSCAVVPCRGFMLKNCTVDNVFIGLWGLNPRLAGFRIMDNHFIARPWTGKGDKWKHLYSEAGIDLNGFGHVVAHNRIDGFWDGINFYGEAVAMDFYNNSVINQKDNSFGTGSNGYCRNIRVWHNSWGGGGPCMHLHPTVGPLLMFRNEIGGGGFFKLQFGRSNGIQYYHNVHELGWESVGENMDKQVVGKLDVRNNIWRGGALSMHTLSSETRIDYNAWQEPQKPGSWQYQSPQGEGSFDNPAALSRAIGWCEHAVVVPDLRALLDGVRPQAETPLVDGGVPLPSINDGFAGLAPDIGMLELGDAVPVYGPRS